MLPHYLQVFSMNMLTITQSLKMPLPIKGGFPISNKPLVYMVEISQPQASTGTETHLQAELIGGGRQFARIKGRRRRHGL